MSRSYPNFSFTVTARDPGSKARCGVINTPHGPLETPNFVFCATKGAMKSVTTEQLRAVGADIILANTYHLFLRPGADWVRESGGLHKMLDWSGPMLTDSGGFQIFSFGYGNVADEIKGKGQRLRETKMLRISRHGATFRSYIDGSKKLLTPEDSIAAQRAFGADLIFSLDECTPYHVSRDYTARSLELSHVWEKRSLDEFKRGDDGRQALYGIVQGGVYPDLRQISAQFVKDHDFFGQAVGGSLGASKDQMHEVVATCMSYLAEDRPTHLLGIGGIDDIWHGVAQGIDTFDCVQPTRIARHGGALTFASHKEGKDRLNLRNACFANDRRPLEDDCDCYACRRFNRAYIHYLFKADELLAGTLLTIHNCAFMVRLLRTIRQAIKNGTFAAERERWRVKKTPPRG